MLYLTGVSPISFPGLGIDWFNLPQVLPFTVFGRPIYFYGLIIAVGFVLAILYGKRRCRDFGYNFDKVVDALLWAVPLAIVCARIYYVVFYWNEGGYAQDPLRIFAIWEGGIAIYGGIIGAAIGLMLFAKLEKQKLSPYLDLMGLGLLIGQLVGRWGNFFNREAHGAETASLFRMGLYELNKETNLVELHYWHPTFLYESVWNLIGFVILHFVSKKRRKYDGQIFLMYVAWYGLGRLWIEGLRTDSLMIGPIRVSQLLAGVSFLAATAIMVWIHFKKHPDGSDMLVNRQKPAEEPEKS